MTAPPTQRRILFTYPRTASNLLLKILALEDQPDVLTADHGGYFFLPSMRLKLREYSIAGKHIDDWTHEEKSAVAASHQSCFDALQEHIQIAEAQNKSVFIKEHVPWLIEPVTETKWLFGKYSTHRKPWTIGSARNTTEPSATHGLVLPDDFLKTLIPTFLIRHPALVIPSNYRTIRDIEGTTNPNIANPNAHALEMTMRPSRVLYDWYVQNVDISTARAAIWPIILDADDIMTNPGVVRRYAKIAGLDHSKLKFSWAPADTQELEKVTKEGARMRSTLFASAGIVEGKTAGECIDIGREAIGWRREFGDEEGERIERWVRAAMPDYEYMRAKRLRA